MANTQSGSKETYSQLVRKIRLTRLWVGLFWTGILVVSVGLGVFIAALAHYPPLFFISVPAGLVIWFFANDKLVELKSAIRRRERRRGYFRDESNFRKRTSS